MQDTDIQSNTASAISSAEEIKEQNKRKRLERIKKIRDSLGDAASRLAYSPSEAAIACGRTPTWGYRRIYDGTFRCTSEGGRLMIPASEIAHFLAAPASITRRKGTGVKAMQKPRNDEPRREPGIHQKLATAEYAVLSLIPNFFGSVFWVVEQKRWQLADQLEALELQR